MSAQPREHMILDGAVDVIKMLPSSACGTTDANILVYTASRGFRYNISVVQERLIFNSNTHTFVTLI